MHSLRHGGATFYLTDLGWAVEKITLHGRWATVESCRHYLQTCRALLSARAVEHVAMIGRVLASDLVRSLTLAQKH